MHASTVLYFLLPLLAVADTGNQGYNGGEDNPQDPDDAGAAGADKGSFALSQGGLIAIIVVAVIVAVAGSMAYRGSRNKRRWLIW
jgi:hypothetical protein